MKYEIVEFRQRQLYDRKRGLYKAKEAFFTVDGIEHSLIIEMDDFNAGKATEIIEAEVKKISDVMEKKKGTIGTK